jgi:protein transport protein YIF1
MSYYGNAGNATGGGGSGNFYGQHQQQQQPQQGGGGYGPGFAGTNQQWQAQPQQQQQQQQQQQYGQPSYAPQQQQQQQPNFFGSIGGGGGNTAAPAVSAPSLWNPAAAATTLAAAAAASGMSNQDMLGAGFDIGESLFQKGTARMIPGLETFMLSLRSYFAVDNRYVLNKIKKLLFPFLPSSSSSTSRTMGWKRQQNGAKYTPEGLAVPQYDLPTADENAPDLYIPTMSLITYVLLCALCYGNAGQFNPEVIPNVTTKCIVTQLLEVVCMRFIGFYLMQISPPACPTMLDLCSYTGYKYLGLCINMMIGLLVSHFGFGARAFYVTFLWTATAASYVMLKIMANNLPHNSSNNNNSVMMSGSGGGGGGSGPKREVMVLVFGASQFATMWFVSQTKFL